MLVTHTVLCIPNLTVRAFGVLTHDYSPTGFNLSTQESMEGWTAIAGRIPITFFPIENFLFTWLHAYMILHAPIYTHKIKKTYTTPQHRFSHELGFVKLLISLRTMFQSYLCQRNYDYYLVWIRGYTVFMTGCYRTHLTVYYSYSQI